MASITNCPDGAGSINNPLNNSGLSSVSSYVVPDICVGTLTHDEECSKDESYYEESLAVENLNISGAALNVFKLLGIHEQGKLMDLTGSGKPLGSGIPSKAFDSLAESWSSSETGLDVVQKPAYIGYDFGIRKTSFNQPENAGDTDVMMHITSFRIQQGSSTNNRALQVRVDRSDGNYFLDYGAVLFSGVGNGSITGFTPGVSAKPGIISLVASSPNQFTVMFISDSTSVLGVASVNARFNSTVCSFNLSQGTIPFEACDMFTAETQLEWKRVDIVNLPNIPTPALVRIKQSAASRYWRLVPTSFAGSLSGDAWVIEKLEMFDYQQTRLDDIQDTLYLENRDRDYAKTSIQIKAAYTPQSSVADMSKFGFQIADVYSFNTTYATMVGALGRPIVVGDILEVPTEMEYDHNLKPVRKFIEVTDVGWATDGRTVNWRPIIYSFQAQQLIPSQETRDILGTVDTQKYVIDDGSFFDGVEQIQTAPLTVTESNRAESLFDVPEKGVNVREQASGTNRFQQPGSYDGVGLYVEDGLPPDAQTYTSGFKLPDVSAVSDGDFFRLEYDPKLNIPARLYKFSGIKNKWIYVETDRRAQRSAHKPSQLQILNSENIKPLSSKI